MADDQRAAKVFSIPAGEPFADRLADGLLAFAAADGDALALADMQVRLPNRRACRTFQEALLRRGGDRVALLPAIRAIGDVDEESLIGRGADRASLDTILSLRPAVPPLLRHLILARLIMAAARMRGIPEAQAMVLAADLARFLDEVALEGCDLDDLDRLAPESYAEHWQKTVDFLKILARHWPSILAENGWLDITDRRIALIEAQAAAWRADPPSGRVIIAGSTGSIKATGALMSAVIDLPRGMLVLPGLDTVMDPRSWQELDENHPQFGFKRLLAGLAVKPEAVGTWPGTGPAPRMALLREALRPAATTEAWQTLARPQGKTPSIEPTALEGLSLIECDNASEEATVIALILRQTLETAGQRAALVTLDRNLARRVTTALERWGIRIDDSAGTPLAQTAIGRFFGLLTAAAEADFAPVALLALLKHPVTAAGLEPATLARLVGLLDRRALRGPRPPPGLDGLRRTVAAAGTETAARLEPLLAALEACLAPLLAALNGKAKLAEAVDALVVCAEALAATPDTAGADRLWRGEDGEAMRGFLVELHDALAQESVLFDTAALDSNALGAVLGTLMQSQTVRPRYGSHPRLSILGPLEARLYQADIMILGGLNEESWPPRIAADPWLSRPMRYRFGLPAPERQIGLSAHDFVQAAAAPRAILTRSLRSGNAPTVPARWLRRLQAVIDAAGLQDKLDRGETWRGWAAALDSAASVTPAPRPAPCPPLASRPRELPVTAIETWRRDPYALYARRILGLRKLDEIEQKAEAAERGTLIHRALELFMQRHRTSWPDDPHEALCEAGREAFGERLQDSDVWAFWWPRFLRIAEVFVEIEAPRRADYETVALETAGQLEIAAPAGPFLLTAKADRIDRRREDGALAIIDYKTGALPKKGDVAQGFAPQLTLQAAIAQHGFGDLPPAAVAEIAYWQLNGSTIAAKANRAQTENIEDDAAKALAGLGRWIARFDDPATPYRALPFPGFEPAFRDYDQLSRRAEWQAGEHRP